MKTKENEKERKKGPRQDILFILSTKDTKPKLFPKDNVRML
jgi:hypothetical protein